MLSNKIYEYTILHLCFTAFKHFYFRGNDMKRDYNNSCAMKNDGTMLQRLALEGKEHFQSYCSSQKFPSISHIFTQHLK